MHLRTWLCDFESKPSLHPDGHLTRKVVVKAVWKKDAVKLAKEELAFWDPINHLFYKVPKLTALEASATEYEQEYETEKNRAKQTELFKQTPKPDTINELEVLIRGKEPEEESKSDLEDSIEALNVQLDNLLPGETLALDNIPNEVYHGSYGDSSSKIKDSYQSMMYYNARYNTGEIERPKGTHFDVGNLAHALISEPETVGQLYKKKPEMPQPTEPQRKKYDEWIRLGRPTKEDDYKSQPSDIAIERCEFWDEFLAENKNVTVVDQDNWKIAEDMSKAVHNNEIAAKILNHSNRKAEISYFHRDIETGRIIKVRTDIDLGSIIADVKTISLRRKVDEKYLLNVLRNEVTQRKYDLSAAMYLDITGAKQFVWIFVNKEPGYHWVAAIRAGDKTLAYGRELYRDKIAEIQHCQEVGIWPGPKSIQRVYNPDTEQLELPVI